MMSQQQQTDEEYGMKNPFANNDSPIIMRSNDDGNLLPSSEEYKVDLANRYKPALGGCFWKVGALVCVGVLVAIILPTVLVVGGEKKEYDALYPTSFEVDCDAVDCTPVSLDLSAATATEPEQVWNIYYVEEAPLQVHVSLPNLPSLHVYMAHQYPKQGMSCHHGEWLTPVNVAPNSAVVSIPVDKSGAVVVCDSQRQMVAIAYQLFAAIPDATDATVVVPLDLTATHDHTAASPRQTLDLATTTSAVVLPIATIGTQGESLLYTHDNSRQIGDACYTDDGEMVYNVPVTFVFGLHLWSINNLENLQDVSETTVFTCVDEMVRAVGVVSYTNSMTTTATTWTTAATTPDNNSTVATGTSFASGVATTNATATAGTIPATTAGTTIEAATNATSAESDATTTAATTFQEDYYD